MMKVNFKFDNGVEVEDIVSGLTGIIDCASVWLNGCKRYSVQPRVQLLENNKPEAIWMDEANLVKISDGVNRKIKPKDTGGQSSINTSQRSGDSR